MAEDRCPSKVLIGQNSLSAPSGRLCHAQGGGGRRTRRATLKRLAASPIGGDPSAAPAPCASSRRPKPRLLVRRLPAPYPVTGHKTGRAKPTSEDGGPRLERRPRAHGS